MVVTAALPYANGDIHLGHLVEYVQTDIWVRFQKMRGHEALYICADDTHGTPIMIAANQKGIKPEQLIQKAHEDHVRDFARFQVAFDHFGSTNSPENKELAGEIFSKMQAAGHIDTRSITQAYCETDKMFLPDRFVKGTCPKCGTKDQYGDACENCSATYAPMELKDPRCSICGTSPVQKNSEHLFFRLEDFHAFLDKWVKEHTQPEVASKLNEWLSEKLRDWDISRDAPYFGFEIPNHPGKFFYVWLDAPIGYISSTLQWCQKNHKELSDYWRSENTEIYHFIGKDIVYFHTLFWPAMLKASGYTLPTRVFAHGMLKVNGEKMSKSRGTFINAHTFQKYVDPTYLRYYYACKLSSGVDDIDLSFDDFISRVNSDLIGKITNVASRGFQMLHRSFDGKLGVVDPNAHELLESAARNGEAIALHFENREYSKALVMIREIADGANRYFDQNEPWKLLKTEPEKTHQILTTILNLFRIMSVYLKPVLPEYVSQVESLFCEGPFCWKSASEIKENVLTKKYEHLAKRLEPKQIESILEETKKAFATTAASVVSEESQHIDIDHFSAVDLRVAKIAKAEEVPEARKLLRLTLDLGDETRNVFAGIKASYDPHEIEGRLVIMVANLKPRKMKFGVSEGMVLCAGDGKRVYLLQPDEGASPGDRVS